MQYMHAEVSNAAIYTAKLVKKVSYLQSNADYILLSIFSIVVQNVQKKA